MQLLHHSHLECIINGHRFVGWASDNPPYEFNFEDAVEVEEGQDGGLYGIGLPRLGGEAVFKLMPTSPTCQWCMQQEQLRKNAHKMGAALRVYAGTFSDPVQNVRWNLAGGLIIMFPAIRVAGQTYEVRLRFEEITASVDGGVFHPPGTSDETGA